MSNIDLVGGRLSRSTLFLNGGMLRGSLRGSVTAFGPSPRLLSCSSSDRQAASFQSTVVPRLLLVPLTRRCSASARMSQEKENPSLKHDSSSPSKAVNARIKGTVQGVFYRKWTVDTAQKLGLNGWVRNCRDGSVEAVFSGPQDLVDSMLHKCRVGPPAAKVTALDVSAWADPVPEGFQQKPTTW